ncbi:MAG: beta strand repeat-containing protein [Reyranellaceae bacterium]
MARWTFFHTAGDLNDPPATLYSAVGGGITQLPGVAGGGQLLVTSSLYVNGAFRLPFADISGNFIVNNPGGFQGDGNQDVLWLNSGSSNNAIVWDELATNQGAPMFGAGRYGLPGGQLGQQTISIEIIRGGDVNRTGTSEDIVSHDFVNLSYNAANGGVAYVLPITLDLGNGRDLAVSGEGDDVIYGGDENLGLGDGLLGMGGNDTIYGGLNVSTHSVTGTRGADDLFGYAGNDTLYGFNNGDVYYGDDGNDVIYMPGSAFTTDVAGPINPASPGAIPNFDTATAFGGNGDDTIFASRLADSGGTGPLAVHEYFFGGNVVSDWVDAEYFLNANGQDNSLNDTVNYSFVTASVTIDLETGLTDNENDFMQYGTGAGGAVNDRFYGIEHLVGTSFNDTLIGSSVGNRLEGGLGNDSLSGEAGSDTLIGGDGDDTIDAGADNDLVEGGVGADSLRGGTGNDTLSYSLSSEAVNVTLGGGGFGGDAEGDTVASDFENLLGSAHNDTLVGDANVNTILGGLGDDTIEGAGGADFLAGQGGNNFLSYASSNAAVTVNLATNVATGGHATGDTFSGFANAIGSAHNDSFVGSSGANTIIGNEGSDTVDGGLGDDVMYGGVYLAEKNNDDWLTYSNAPSAVQVSLFQGTATGGYGNDSFNAFQHLIGSASGADFLEGDEDNNSILGQGGNDTLSGLGGIDSLFGGGGNDTILAGTNGGTFDNTTISGWDGEAGSAAVDVFVPIFSARVSDRMFGGGGTDTIDMQNLVSATNSVMNPGDSTISNYVAGIEIIIAGAAADVINLTFNDGVTRSAYTENVTIFAGDNADVVFSGSGNDLVVGGRQNGTATGEAGDTLFGGAGDDTIFGDDLNASGFGGADRIFGGAGNDTAYGGVGEDSVSGGTGNDLLFDFDGGHLFGGDDRDLLIMNDTNNGTYTLVGGVNAATDASDLAFVSGNYVMVTSTLGEGADRFYSSSTDSGSAQIDRVAGENGDDLISTWFGNDIVDGGAGNDVIWGGAGSDTIYGGPGTDFLYGGAGDGDVLIGGAGIDYYYWSRTDGNDLIMDVNPADPTPNPVPETGARVNALVVFPDFDTTEVTAGSDQLRNGTGVVETDGDLYDNAGGDDMVRLVDIDGAGGTMYRLDILTGAGAGNSVTFDQQDVSVIMLWNNDAAAGTPVIQQYVWDPVDGRYELA